MDIIWYWLGFAFHAALLAIVLGGFVIVGAWYIKIRQIRD